MAMQKLFMFMMLTIVKLWLTESNPKLVLCQTLSYSTSVRCFIYLQTVDAGVSGTYPDFSGGHGEQKPKASLAKT